MSLTQSLPAFMNRAQDDEYFYTWVAQSIPFSYIFTTPSCKLRNKYKIGIWDMPLSMVADTISQHFPPSSREAHIWQAAYKLFIGQYERILHCKIEVFYFGSFAKQDEMINDFAEFNCTVNGAKIGWVHINPDMLYDHFYSYAIGGISALMTNRISIEQTKLDNIRCDYSTIDASGMVATESDSLDDWIYDTCTPGLTKADLYTLYCKYTTTPKSLRAFHRRVTSCGFVEKLNGDVPIYVCEYDTHK